MDILLSFKTNLRHLHLVNCVVASLFNDLMTSISWLSMLYSFKTHQRPSCQTRRLDRTLSWSRWNYERAPSNVPDIFQPTPSASGWIFVQWFSCVIWSLVVPLPRSVLPTSLLGITRGLTLLDQANRSAVLAESCVAFFGRETESVSSLWAIFHWSRFSDMQRWSSML